MKKGNKQVSLASGVSKEFMKDIPSPQRGDGAFVGGAVQMQVRGKKAATRMNSLLTCHYERICGRSKSG